MEGKKILVIEDESIIAMGTRNVLEMKGYSVVGPALNGREAIELALKHLPDLILADVLLSGDIDGIEAVEEIQKSLDVPVVYLTAHTKESYFARARATRPYGYLIKPASQSDIYSTIDLALYKHEMESRLRESEARYRSLVDNSLNAIAIYQAVSDGKDFIILDFNSSAERIENVKREDILGKRVTEVFPGVTEFGLLKVFQEAWKTGIPREHPLALYKDERIAGWKENFVFKLPTGEIVAVYRDVTQQKQAEEELRESEARFRAIINDAHVGYFFLDNEGIFLQINDAFLRMHKYGSADELRGKHNSIIFFEADRKDTGKIVGRVLSGEIIPTGELPRRCKDGSLGYSIFSAYPVKKGGRIVGAEGFLLDITEKKNFEEALKISSQLNKEIILNAKIGIVVYDSNLNYVLWNRFMKDLTGVSSAQVLGKNARDFTPLIRGQGAESIIERALAGETVYSPDFQFQVSGTGKTGWARGIYSPHYNAENEIIGAIELLSDVTETKVMENALLESEKKYRELVENSNSIILRRDARGHITFINEFAQKFFGYAENEIVGRNVVGTIIPEYESTGRNLAEMVEDISNYPERYETNMNENMRKNGERVWIAWTNKALKDENGAVREITCIGNDITRRKKMEEELKTALREKELLIREIHHRVKNNMQIISSLLSLQSTFVNDKLDLELFNECHRRVRSMALVHEMVYQSENLARIDFSDYIDQITKQLFMALDKKSPPTRFESDIRDVHLSIVNAMPCALIINELLSNALKYAFPEGRTGTISISFIKNLRGKHTLVIWDDGIGLPKDFEPQNSKTLGLMIVNELVKQLRGTIQLERNPGTRFTIDFAV